MLASAAAIDLDTLVDQGLLSIIAFGGGTAITWTAARASRILPNRRLWQLADPGSLEIYVAASASSDTGKYIRPATGVGQARALAVLMPSLIRGYRGIEVGSIKLSTEAQGDDLAKDVITLGGSKNNRVTRAFLERLADRVPARLEGDAIVWSGHDPITKEGEVREGAIVDDYGLIVQTRNPLNPARTLVILAGSHTYGTIAAAEHFVAEYSRLAHWRTTSFACLVHATVEHDHVCAVRELRFQDVPAP